MTTPPKPSEKLPEKIFLRKVDLLDLNWNGAEGDVHAINSPTSYFITHTEEYVLASAERKRCEEMLEIAEKALDEISLMNIRNIKADQKEGRFWDWKDEARKALARIKALKATQAATGEGVK